MEGFRCPVPSHLCFSLRLDHGPPAHRTQRADYQHRARGAKRKSRRSVRLLSPRPWLVNARLFALRGRGYELEGLICANQTEAQVTAIVVGRRAIAALKPNH